MAYSADPSAFTVSRVKDWDAAEESLIPTEVQAQLLPPHEKDHGVRHYSVELCLGELKTPRYPSVYVKSNSRVEQ
jgi:hypothetical protein